LDNGPGVRIWIAPESGFGCAGAVSTGVEAERDGNGIAVSVRVAVGSRVGSVAVGVGETNCGVEEAVACRATVGLGSIVRVADGSCSVAVAGRLPDGLQPDETAISRREQQRRGRIMLRKSHPGCCRREICG
jgi:hypothetical protein